MLNIRFEFYLDWGLTYDQAGQAVFRPDLRSLSKQLPVTLRVLLDQAVLKPLFLLQGRVKVKISHSSD